MPVFTLSTSSLPIDLIHQICSFTPELLEWFYTMNRKPVATRDCRIWFLFHLACRDNLPLFRSVYEKTRTLSTRLRNMLFEEATMCESEGVLQFLFQQYKYPEDVVRQYLFYAIQEDCSTVIPILLQNYPNLIDASTLEEAVYRNNYSLVKYILNHPQFEDDTEENQAFIVAIQMGHQRIFRYMLHHVRIEPHEPDNAPLKEALYAGHAWFAERLIQHPLVCANLQLDSEERQLLHSLLI